MWFCLDDVEELLDKALKDGWDKVLDVDLIITLKKFCGESLECIHHFDLDVIDIDCNHLSENLLKKIRFELVKALDIAIAKDFYLKEIGLATDFIKWFPRWFFLQPPALIKRFSDYESFTSYVMASFEKYWRRKSKKQKELRT